MPVKKEKIEKVLQGAAEAALEHMGVTGSLIEIYLVSDEVIHEINRNYRRKDNPTNVLSFETPKELPDPEAEFTHLGEIYLAPRYISQHNENVGELMIHGLLHLLGYDHIKSADAKKMEKAEKELIFFLKTEKYLS